MKMNSSWAGNSESDIVMLVNMGLVYENMIRVHLKLDIENGKKKINILDIFGKESIIKVCEAFNVQYIPLN